MRPGSAAILPFPACDPKNNNPACDERVSRDETHLCNSRSGNERIDISLHSGHYYHSQRHGITRNRQRILLAHDSIASIQQADEIRARDLDFAIPLFSSRVYSPNVVVSPLGNALANERQTAREEGLCLVAHSAQLFCSRFPPQPSSTWEYREITVICDFMSRTRGEKRNRGCRRRIPHVRQRRADRRSRRCSAKGTSEYRQLPCEEIEAVSQKSVSRERTRGSWGRGSTFSVLWNE